MRPCRPEDFMRRFPALAALFALALPAAANDGFGGLSATGLTFGRTDAVAMLEEDLFIGLDRISVDYVFRNTTDADVVGEVIFPLPPVAVWSGYEGMMNLPEDLARDDLVDFAATVDGRPVAVKIDRIAVLEEPWDETRPPSAQYDDPGREVTADLERLGLPLTLEGGAFPLLVLPFRLFAGGWFGNGQQYYPWIHIEDYIAALHFLLTTERTKGIFNISAPYPQPNREFAATLGRVMRRPSWLPAPRFALELALGEVSTVVLDGQRAVPMRLLQSGFNFTYPELGPALQDLLERH